MKFVGIVLATAVAGTQAFSPTLPQAASLKRDGKHGRWNLRRFSTGLVTA